MNDQAQRLAMLLEAIEELDREKIAWQTEWKTRKERLRSQAQKLKQEILSGQGSLLDVVDESTASTVELPPGES